ncbi:MAG: phage holin family protein [Mycobacteriales bacterium]
MTSPRVAPDTEPSIGDLVSAASRDMSTLIRGEVELAKTEVVKEVKTAAKGAAMFVVAAVFGFFLLVMLLLAFAEGLIALGLARWAGYLIVAGVLLLSAGVLALIGKRALTKLKAPERTIETTKGTLAWAKHPTKAPVSVVSDGERTAHTVP